MKIIDKNILDVREGFVCHQVNCQGVAGSGLAKQFKDRYPEWYKLYKSWGKGISFLGTNLYYWPNGSSCGRRSGICLISMYAQNKYGRDGAQYTDYTAFERCCDSIKPYLYDSNIYFPYNIGCGLGGGKWEVISNIIGTHFPKAIICKLGL